jgi:hypothetical protein
MSECTVTCHRRGYRIYVAAVPYSINKGAAAGPGMPINKLTRLHLQSESRPDKQIALIDMDQVLSPVWLIPRAAASQPSTPWAAIRRSVCRQISQLNGRLGCAHVDSFGVALRLTRHDSGTGRCATPPSDDL